MTEIRKLGKRQKLCFNRSKRKKNGNFSGLIHCLPFPLISGQKNLLCVSYLFSVYLNPLKVSCLSLTFCSSFFWSYKTQYKCKVVAAKWVIKKDLGKKSCTKNGKQIRGILFKVVSVSPQAFGLYHNFITVLG